MRRLVISIVLLVLLEVLLVPTVAFADGLRILEPREGTRIHPGQMVRMHGVGCPAGGDVTFEAAGSMRADQDGSFTTSFQIPPGPSGDFFLDAKCGGILKEVRLIRSNA
jgi:hypothetical protein